MIDVRTRSQEETRGSRGCFWAAEYTLDDGRRFSARSQHGAANELARQLVAADVPDQPMQTYNQRGVRELYYCSFYEAAKWTYTEGNRSLQRVPYRSPEEIKFAFRPRGQNRGE